MTPQPPGSPPPPSESRLLQTLPGRLFLLSATLLIVLVGARYALGLPVLPELLEVFRKVVSLALLVSLVWLSVVGLARNSRRFLWRVRQKLILSYIFLGFVPVLLIAAFALAGGVVLYNNVAPYMFHEGVDDMRDDIAQIAESTAREIGRAPATAAADLARRYENNSARYPGLSLAVVPVAAREAVAPTAQTAATTIAAGPWRHMAAPALAPAWTAGTAGGFSGVVAVSPSGTPEDWTLVIRVAQPTPDLRRMVLVDLPVDAMMVARLEDHTRTRLGDITVPVACGGSGLAAPARATGGVLALFRRTVAFMDCTNWATGASGRLSMSLDAPLGRLYGRVSAAQSAQLNGGLPGGADVFLRLLVALGVLFLIIQGSALVMGAILARSITYAVHELFEGTERVQRGDFAHRIKIDSTDQLGALAGSFNRMSASIEHLLHVQREKQRLDDELRIAREIQKSLLPTAPPDLAGLLVADLCEPAREVGGDYYDFFDLGPRQVGVMVADVSGKGTSAALYMAELKGLMLALSHSERSPRKLLIEVNRLLSAHLDNRSFITMIYAVIDLDTRTLTCARAGHTPLLVVANGKSEVVVPQGMVLGLRLPGATERFADLLEEYTRPIAPGDVIVLYTDGVTEAMDAAGELFGDEGLERVLAGHYRLDPAGIRERVVREVRAFVGEAEPHDDMTMIVLKIDDRAPEAKG